MARRTTIYKGTIAEIAVTLKSDGTDFKIGDSSSVPSVTAEFYVSGTYDKSGASKVTINRDTDTSKCFVDDSDPYTLNFHVDTSTLPIGNLCVTFKGKYVDTEHNNVQLDFVYSGDVNAEIKAVGV